MIISIDYSVPKTTSKLSVLGAIKLSPTMKDKKGK